MGSNVIKTHKFVPSGGDYVRKAMEVDGISVHKLKDQVKRWVREEWNAIKAEEARA